MLIGDLSKATGCPIETIRYYERIGVIPSPPRTPGGQRDYQTFHHKRLAFVRRSRELGFSLNEVRQMLKLVDGGTVTCDQVQRMAMAHLADVRAKIADLKRMEKTLQTTVAECGGGQSPDCPIVDSLFRGGPTGQAAS